VHHIFLALKRCEQEEDQEDDDVNIIVFLAMKNYEEL
jgi:hypothetical protein